MGVRNRAKWKCEWCGVPNAQLGGRTAAGTWCKAQPTGTGGRGSSGFTWPAEGEDGWCTHPKDGSTIRLRIVRIVLTVAHLNHKPEDCADENLKAGCQRCHNIYDLPHRRAGIEERARAERAVGDLFA